MLGKSAARAAPLRSVDPDSEANHDPQTTDHNLYAGARRLDLLDRQPMMPALSLSAFSKLSIHRNS